MILSAVPHDIALVARENASHVAGYAWVGVDPPGASYAGLTFQQTEVGAAQHSLQLAGHSNASISPSNDDDLLVMRAEALLSLT